jgi:hypothetical protein
MGRPGPFVGRLIDRATRRGDAAQIALRLRVRAPDHPFTPFMVDHLLSASMVSDPRH